MGITLAGDVDRRRSRAGAQPFTGTVPIAGTARVLLQFSLGLLAIALVRAAASTVGRRPAGLALLGRSGGRLAELAGPVAAVLTAARARRTVPAYRAASRTSRPWRAACRAGQLTGYLQALPVLDKAGYVDRYPVAQRCQGGELPATGIEVDESSGSSGRPYQWVRSRAELDQVERGLAVQAGWLLRERRHERVVVLNCFSMGAWATGASVTAALRRLGAIKSCGPEPDKALAAIELLGPDACYVVCGYPPFLASLLDAARRGPARAGLRDPADRTGRRSLPGQRAPDQAPVRPYVER